MSKDPKTSKFIRSTFNEADSEEQGREGRRTGTRWTPLW
eukprot:SAG22_NODE_9650_length_577_cov_0.813808_1_plen_38_part_10